MKERGVGGCFACLVVERSESVSEKKCVRLFAKCGALRRESRNGALSPPKKATEIAYFSGAQTNPKLLRCMGEADVRACALVARPLSFDGPARLCRRFKGRISSVLPCAPFEVDAHQERKSSNLGSVSATYESHVQHRHSSSKHVTKR